MLSSVVLGDMLGRVTTLPPKPTTELRYTIGSNTEQPTMEMAARIVNILEEGALICSGLTIEIQPVVHEVVHG
jgi:hypothetical protein